MNFFKSVFADDDPDPPTSPTSDHEEQSSPSSSNPTQTHQPTTSDDDNDGSEPNSDQTNPSPVWSFGGLIKTLQVKSDWIDTYRRDLEEFGSGLKKETEVLREVASKAVKELPSSLEIGASKAQVSLESVGQALDSIGFAMADILSHGKESLLPHDNDSYDVNNSNLQSVSSGRYSRFDAQLRAIQCDANTYVDEPDDVVDYNKWLSEFNLDEKSEEIEGLIKENGSIDGIYKRVVPNSVEHEVFWSRYFYRVHRLKQAENVRAKLVKRAISTEDEEELSWDVDDDDDDDEEEEVKEEVKKVGGSDANSSNVARKEEKEKKIVEGEHKVVVDTHVESSVSAEQRAGRSENVEAKEKSSPIESTDNVTSQANEDDEASKKLKEKVASEGKTEPSESGKDSDISVVSTQPSTEEDDMGWDEIEDIGSGDEKKDTRSRSPNREELRKRLSTADVDEDLSWDIEDDD